MDEAILGGGISLIDTAEQYPIPSGPGNPEGDTGMHGTLGRTPSCWRASLV